jgi:hypothetical protein
LFEASRKRTTVRVALSRVALSLAARDAVRWALADDVSDVTLPTCADAAGTVVSEWVADVTRP